MNKIVKQVIPDYANIQDMTSALTQKYPFLECNTIGQSVQSRDIISFSVGKGNNPILYAGGFHAQEWLTVLFLFKFLENICECADTNTEMSGLNVQSILETRKLIIVPCANPDGTEFALHGFGDTDISKVLSHDITEKELHNWSANAHGVDINHNFDAGWDKVHKLEIKAGITGPAHKQYGGTAPESEPETRAIVNLCKSSNIRHVLAFHSQGEEIYWQYGKSTPERSYMMAKIFSASSDYKMVLNEGLASHGGFKDWVIDKLHIPAFTIEIGKGKNPLPITELDSIYERLEEMMILAALM